MNDVPSKVLHVVNEFDAGSGIASLLMNLYRNVDRNVIQFDFLIFKRPTKEANVLEQEIVAMGGKIFSFIISPCALVCLNRKMDVFFREKSGEYIAVHLHTPSLCEFTLKYAKRYNWKNRIVHSHSSMMSASFIKRTIHKFLLRHRFSYGNIFFACSTEAGRFLFGGKRNYKIITNVADTTKFLYKDEMSYRLKESLNINDKIVVLHVSNFSAMKNMSFFVDVMKNMDNDKIQYVFVGDGETFGKVKKKVEKSGLISKCLFVGKSYEPEKFFAMADAFVLPSIKEGLPVSVIEAQACGVPCYISDSITKEVDAGLVRYIKLSCEEWVKALSHVELLSDVQRKKNYDVFKRSRFDLKHEALRIQNLYLSMK